MRLTKTLKFFAVSFSILVRSFLTYRTTFLKFFFVITLCFSNDLYFKLWKTNCFSSKRTFLILFLSSIHFSQTKFAHSTTNQPLLFFYSWLFSDLQTLINPFMPLDYVWGIDRSFILAWTPFLPQKNWDLQSYVHTSVIF